ncbi:MAG: SGNH/GDSL hydrolase family protein [Bdellovibrionales bacterium]|nr:SGNH/GDSL hydrolase family protein [Bdellovibrionales bacterium]
MRSEYIIGICAWIASLVIAVFVFGAVAPELVGRPKDLEIVQLSQEKPAFFENVFSRKDLEANDLLVNDPIVVVRGRPLLPAIHGVGPHDLLGFRNDKVPSVADIVTIGDSQTYGMNAVLADAWPSVVRSLIPQVETYSMAIGGWSAPQYLSLFEKALSLEPSVVVVAIYTGNDALESFRTAYGVEYWRGLRLDPDAQLSDLPKVPFPPPKESWYRLKRDDGLEVTFTPELRAASNDSENRAVRVGYEIISHAIQQMALVANAKGFALYVTAIPTKELVYEKWLLNSQQSLPDSLKRLLLNERAHIERISQDTEKNAGAHYIDLIAPLQSAIDTVPDLYPVNQDGHPLRNGYRVIGETIARAIKGDVVLLGDGFYRVNVSDQESWYYAKKGDSCVQFASAEAFTRVTSRGVEGIMSVPLKRLQRCTLQGRYQ